MSAIIIIGIIYGIIKAISAANAANRERRRQAEIARQRAEAERMRREWREAQARAKEETARMVALEREQIRQAKEQARQAAALAKEEKERKAADEKLAKAVLALNKKVEQAYFRIEKAEDEIARFGSVLEQLTAQKQSKEKELADVREKLTLVVEGLDFDPRTDEGNAIFDRNDYGSADGAVLFQERFAKALDDKQSGKKKDTGKEREKLEKREASLVNQIVVLDGRIFTADQKIKKAVHDKYEAEMDKAFCEKKLEVA